MRWERWCSSWTDSPLSLSRSAPKRSLFHLHPTRLSSELVGVTLLSLSPNDWLLVFLLKKSWNFFVMLEVGSLPEMRERILSKRDYSPLDNWVHEVHGHYGSRRWRKKRWPLKVLPEESQPNQIQLIKLLQRETYTSLLLNTYVGQ